MDANAKKNIEKTMKACKAKTADVAEQITKITKDLRILSEEDNIDRGKLDVILGKLRKISKG
jgi:hypothetical protein